MCRKVNAIMDYNGNIMILDQRALSSGNGAVDCVKVGRCKYIVVTNKNGGIAVTHAADCEYCAQKELRKEQNQ